MIGPFSPETCVATKWEAIPLNRANLRQALS